MIVKQILFFGKNVAVACDEKCNKAWGTNNRPKKYLSDDRDDYAFLSDKELPTAPDVTGTYEGDKTKPLCDEDKLNKWCVRECERSSLVSKEDGLSRLKDFSCRVFNKGGI